MNFIHCVFTTAVKPWGPAPLNSIHSSEQQSQSLTDVKRVYESKKKEKKKKRLSSLCLLFLYSRMAEIEPICFCGRFSDHNQFIMNQIFFCPWNEAPKHEQHCVHTHTRTQNTQAVAYYCTRFNVEQMCTVYCSNVHGNKILFHSDVNLSQFSRQDTMTSAPSLQEITVGAQWNSFIIHIRRTAFYSPRQRLIEQT